ncbi:MAG: DUF4276 family protein [Ottowia sp.]|nr:DUF4276 family protein [Ottowia sp.]
MTVEVIVIAEGQTEEQFIKRVVAPVFQGLGVFIKPLLMSTSANVRGGAVTFDRFMFNARNELRRNANVVLSCFLDLYKLDTSFPEYARAQALPDLDSRVDCLNKALHVAVTERIGVQPNRFIPHIQPHEFEGLLFADTTALVSIEPEWVCRESTLRSILEKVPTPEHINNGFETKPSRRLETLLTPSYKKTRHGPLAAQKVGVVVMERECLSFKKWMESLRALSA